MSDILVGAALRKERRYLHRKWPEYVLHPQTPATCDKCEKNASCEFAFDRYNTDGDCLDSK